MLNTIASFTLRFIVWCVLCLLLSVRFVLLVLNHLTRLGAISFLQSFLLIFLSSPTDSVVNIITTIIFECLACSKDIWAAISVTHLCVALSFTIICNKLQNAFKETLSGLNEVLIK